MVSRLVAILFLSFYALVGYGQVIPASQFKARVPPTDWKELQQLNYSTSYQVENIGGELVVSLAQERSNFTELQLPEGKITGKDHGEFGGELVFKAAASKKSTVIKEGNIVLIFQQRGQLYFIEGLAHMSTNTGALYRLEGKAPNFSYTQILSFDNAPEAFAQLGDTVYIAQSSGFTVLHKLKKEVVFTKTFWGSLYPNSVAVFGAETVYVGMRGGYAELNITTKKVRFFQKL